MMAAEAMHMNYSPAEHRRVVALTDEEFLLVLDKITGMEPAATVQLYFNLDTTSL